MPRLRGTLYHAMRYSFASHLYAARVGDAYVLLDLASGRYRGIAGHKAHELTRLLDHDDASTPLQGVAWLEQGILTQKETEHPFCASRIDLGSALCAPCDATASTTLSASCLLTFAVACASTHWRLRHQSLQRIAQHLSFRKQFVPHADTSQRLLHAVSQFRLLRPFAFTANDRCLFHALALTTYLTLLRLPATWIIGVRLHPWGAHSWVQTGPLVLDSTPEIVREYVPILAV